MCRVDARVVAASRWRIDPHGRAALTARGITPCIPPKSNRKVQYHYDKAVYKKRHMVENLFAKIKDWRRIHTRYDRCAHTFMSAICIAATVIFWL